MFTLKKVLKGFKPAKNLIYLSLNMLSVISGPIYKIEHRNLDIYLNPIKTEHKETIIWLHGLGDSAEGFVDVFLDERLNPVKSSTKVVLLTAPTNPVSINGNFEMPSWYDIKIMSSSPQSTKTSFDDRFSRKEILDNTERIHAVFKEEIKQLKHNSQKLFVGGFSQGCAMSLHAALTYPEILGGIFAFSGYLFEITDIKEEHIEKLPMFIYHGAADPMIPIKEARESYKRLKGKFTFQIETDLGHSINDRQLRMFRGQFDKLVTAPKEEL